ncbi:iron uptake protein [Ottowia thiooxydans]|uniref:Nitrogen fixation-related uncharacterized protein n=1 Tax=Ottowia thiooxydans TaxID=219182 RepID=A0ABV2Q203_9BURK
MPHAFAISTMASHNFRSRWHAVPRIFAACLGGYMFTWGFIALGISGFFSLGMPFNDAERLSNILGMLVYLVAFLWAFSRRSTALVWSVLAVSGVVMTAMASLLQLVLT